MKEFKKKLHGFHVKSFLAMHIFVVIDWIYVFSLITWMMSFYTQTLQIWDIYSVFLPLMKPNTRLSPAERNSGHRHPRDAADAPPLLPAVTVTRAAVFVFVLFLWSLAPVPTVTAAVMYEEAQNHQEGDDKSDGW